MILIILWPLGRGTQGLVKSGESMKKVWILLIVAMLVGCLLAACGESETVSVTGVAISGLKSTYTQNEQVDYDGVTLTVSFSDGTSTRVPLVPAMITKGITTSSLGRKTFSAIYQDYPFTFNYTVNAPAIVSRITEVRIEGLADTYKIDDPIDLADCKLVIVIDGEDEPIEVDLSTRMIAGFDTSRAGTRTLSVSYETTYGTAVCEFEYTVLPRNIVSVTPTTPQLSFYQDDEVDALLAVLADYPFEILYSDDTTAQVTVTEAKAITGFVTSMIEDAATCTVKVTDRTGRYMNVQLTYKVKERYDEQQVTFVSQDFSFNVMTQDGYVEEPVLTQPGYSLIGWFTNENVQFNFATRLSAPVTLIAKWEAIRYTVSLYNFGELDGTLEYTVETAKSLPTPAPRNGYTFAGYVDATGNAFAQIPKGMLGSFALYGQWTANTYQITYLLGDEASSIKASHDNPSTYTIDTTEDLSPAVRAGFDFVGWTDQESGRIVESMAGLWGDRVLVANWQATLYTVYFKLDVNGEVLSTMTFRVTDSDTKLPVPTIEGYRFLGWYNDQACTQEVQKDKNGNYLLLAGSSGDRDIFAKTIKTYTITLDHADGTPQEAVEFALSDGVILLPLATRFGCDFTAWVDEEGTRYTPNGEGNIAFAPEAAATYDGKTLTAEWSEHVHTITYRMLYVDPESMKEEEVTAQGTYGAITDTPLLLPTRGGYVFVAWYITEQLIGTPYTTLPACTFDRDLELFAYWQIQTYTITVHYGLNESLVTPVEVPRTYRLIDTIGLDRPSARYHEFVGWYLEPECVTRVSEIRNRYGDIDLYADWSEIVYSPSIYNQGGAPFDGNYNLPTYTYSTTGTINLGTATRTGYTFAGWYSDEGCTTKVTSFAPQNYLDNPPTFYAKWSVVSYQLTYNFVTSTGTTVSGVTNTNAKSFTVESNVDFVPPTKNGYLFGGWYLDSAGTVGIESTQGYAEKLTVYGRLDLGTYTIQYDQATIADVIDPAVLASLPTSYVLGDTNTNSTTFKSNVVNKITRAGYYLKGLYIESAPTSMLTALGATSVSATAPACQDVTLYALWYPITFTVTYKYRKLATGTTLSTLTANDYKTVTVTDLEEGFTLPDPLELDASLSGRAYNGWYPSDNTEGYLADGMLVMTTADLAKFSISPRAVDASQTATASLTLYTRLLAIDYAITYHMPDGATNPNTKTSYQYATTGNTLQAATMEGYTFISWCLDEELQETVANLNGRTGDVDLYPYFEKNIAVTFEMNGSTTKMTAVTYTANKATTLTQKPTLSGHTFAGWWYVEGATYIGTIIPAELREDTLTLRAMFYNSSTATLTLTTDGQHATITGKTFTSSTAVILPTYMGGTEVQIPVTEIAGSAFRSANISTLTWAPTGKAPTITTVGTYAFYEATMTALTIPDSLTSVGRNAFGGLSRVTTLTLNATLPQNTLSCPNATTVVLNVDPSSGALSGLSAVATLTLSGNYALSYIFGSVSAIPSSLVTLHVTNSSLAANLLTGSNVSTLYLDGEMIDLDSFTLLYNYAQGHELALKVPSALLSDYRTAYQAYVDQLDNLTLS